MKIGIITFHSGFNYGAFFQVYALQKAIAALGHNCHIINYKNFKHTYKEYKAAAYSLNPLVLPTRLSRIINFRSAQRRLRMTKRTFSASEDAFDCFDAILYGADEIWNLNNCLFGVDDVYFGDKANGVKRISYAASFGNYALGENGLPEKYINLLKKYKYISVRDTNSLDIIKSNIDSEAVIVPDPTFLYDFFAEKKSSKLANEKYIAVYATAISKGLQREILAFAKKRNLKIFAFGYRKKWADRNIITLDPFQLIDAIQMAKIVFTNMFHGTIFSFLSGRQFCLELSKYRLNKFSPMLSMVGVEDRVYNENFGEIIEKNIDYAKVGRKIKNYSNIGFSYLKKALAG